MSGSVFLSFSDFRSIFSKVDSNLPSELKVKNCVPPGTARNRGIPLDSCDSRRLESDDARTSGN